EARGEPERAADFDQEDGIIAAGAGPGGERRSSGLDTLLITPTVAERSLDRLVERGEEGDGVSRRRRHPLLEPGAQGAARAVSARGQVGQQRHPLRLVIGKRIRERRWPEEEVEGVGVEGLDQEVA